MLYRLIVTSTTRQRCWLRAHATAQLGGANEADAAALSSAPADKHQHAPR
jgi:hypothetical protein